MFMCECSGTGPAGSRTCWQYLSGFVVFRKNQEITYSKRMLKPLTIYHTHTSTMHVLQNNNNNVAHVCSRIYLFYILKATTTISKRI